MNESALKVILELGPKYGVDFFRYTQFKGVVSGKWFDCVNIFDLVDNNNACEYRVKPRTHIVNGIECPAPRSERPENGSIFWYVESMKPGVATGYFMEHSKYCEWLFKIGIFHTREDALANFYAHYPHMRPEAE